MGPFFGQKQESGHFVELYTDAIKKSSSWELVMCVPTYSIVFGVQDT